MPVYPLFALAFAITSMTVAAGCLSLLFVLLAVEGIAVFHILDSYFCDMRHGRISILLAGIPVLGFAAYLADVLLPLVVCIAVATTVLNAIGIRRTA